MLGYGVKLGGGGRTPWISPAYLLYQPFVLKDLRCFSVITGKARIQKGKRTRISGYYRYSVVVQRSPTPSDKDGWGRGDRCDISIPPFGQRTLYGSRTSKFPFECQRFPGRRTDERGCFPCVGVGGGGLSNLIDMSYLVSHSTH